MRQRTLFVDVRTGGGETRLGRPPGALAVGLAALVALTACSEPPQVPGPFGILRLPAEYESHRISLRQELIRDMGETVVAAMEGEGCLRHLWLTVEPIVERPAEGLLLVLRIYADGSSEPSVEVPVAPFFGLHHGHRPVAIDSPYLSVTKKGGLNAYFPMPFARGLVVTLHNEGREDYGVWLQADYHRYATGALDEGLRFHASYRRLNRAQRFGKPYHVGHSRGRGVLLGVSLGMRVFDDTDEWFHSGGDLVLLDGDSAAARLLSGIGGEDFFGTAWGLRAFSAGPIGSPYHRRAEQPRAGEPSAVFAAYRFFHRDPIGFRESFWFDFGSLANDMSSVLYWYQEPLAAPSGALPPPERRLPRALAAEVDPIDPPGTARTWQVCGPFATGTREEFERREPPEEGIELSYSRPADFGQYAEAVTRAGFSTAVHETAWVTDVPARFNFVDLTPYFRPRLPTNAGLPTDVSAYAATTVESAGNRRARIRIGHDDWLRLWLNGELVYHGDEQSGFRTHELEVDLRQGENDVLLKVANRDNTNFRAWVFLFDVLD